MNTPGTKWLTSFDIFVRNGMGEYDIDAEHDVIYVHCQQVLWDSDDGRALREMGWGKDERRFRRNAGHEPPCEDESWYHYV